MLLDQVARYMDAPGILTAAVVGYLLGSVPFGLILTRMAGLGDVRSLGSGNIGATNVLRTGNKKLAAATLLLDALKASLAVVLMRTYFGEDAAATAGFFAFIGHIYPIWIGFKGGKGVATYLGVLIGIVPMMAGAFAIVWLLVAFLSRYSSLAALIAMLSIPPLLYVTARADVALIAATMTVISYWKHRKNIARLLGRSESRIGA
jgi:glycerol-3-phosphate acyltransferase PlsY